jgi:hypothetical protein
MFDPTRPDKSLFETWYKITTSTTATPAEIEASLMGSHDVIQHADRTLECNISKALCTTTDGRMAMVPGKTQPNDPIIVFAWGDTPFVVRSMDGYRILVGVCYLHGIMFGEAFPADESGLDWFTLR